MGYPTPYPEVNHILDLLRSRIQEILGTQFVGMYLYGSLALGDFDPHSSDIDFLVVTHDTVSENDYKNLQAMHHQIGSLPSKWATELEGSYIPVNALRLYNPAYATHPHIDRGNSELSIQKHDMDWIIQRYVLREYGITIVGESIKTLIDPISSAILQKTLLDLLLFWWHPMVKNPAPLIDDGYRSYAVLTMCRILYTFQHGTITSKPVAAKWAFNHLDDHWAGLVNRALTHRNGTPLNTVDAVQSFIHHTLTQIKPS